MTGFPVDLHALAEELAPLIAAELQGREPLYSPKTLAERLDIHERTVRQMLADGVIPSMLVSGSRKIDPVDVDRYLAAQKAKAAA